MRGPLSSSAVGRRLSESESGARLGRAAVWAWLAAASIYIALGGFSPAVALPSFARQTGQPCGACHTEFPGLTPYGRRFKLGGYTYGGGPYRTTLFPSVFDQARHLTPAPSQKTTEATASDRQATATSDLWVPPLSMMAILGYTHTKADQDPTGSPYHANDNVVFSPVSFFYGGAITDHIGAFAQVTYNGPPFGAQDAADPFAGYQWTWDNTDIRYANTASVGKLDILYGISANNNPTVQDPWNTTPAWSFPYAVSSIAPGPAASTIIEGAFAGHVVGAGGYLFINDLLYLELSGYRTLNFEAQTKLGADPFGAPGMIDGVAPYWRVAVEPHWGNHWLEFGAFGMSAKVHPWTFATDSNGFYLNDTNPLTDRYTDVAADAQYQYMGPNYWITLRGTYIHEDQSLDATFASGGSDNQTNTLNTFKAMAQLAYGNDNRVVFTGQYFDTRGSSDATLYANLASGLSPDSNGYIFEIAYIPFISSHSPVWPWANARIGLQYTYYNKFDGDTVSAHDNNTLFGYIWFAM